MTYEEPRAPYKIQYLQYNRIHCDQCEVCICIVHRREQYKLQGYGMLLLRIKARYSEGSRSLNSMCRYPRGSLLCAAVARRVQASVIRIFLEGLMVIKARAAIFSSQPSCEKKQA